MNSGPEPTSGRGQKKVSVVVPVFNPGRHIEALIESLDRQTMLVGDFEAIFVDDGSTDDTPARLDRLAAQRSNVTVIHQENSGWPGKPRNVGIGAARGEYIFFCDNDDWLGVEALDRLYAMARRTDADIVIGKMVGHSRGVPRELFRRTVERATLADTPLIDSLTPHKLFRTAFLERNRLRFPEGKRRLEDHVFVVSAYFLADTISVLADYPCYHHIGRDDVSNAGFVRIDPPSYYGYVRETLAIVESNTSPGVLRDRLLRRFLRQEMLARLTGRQFVRADVQYQRVLFDEVRRLIRERIPTTVDEGLPGRQRVLADTVRRGDLGDVLELAEWSAGVRLDVRLRRIQWRGGALDIEVQARVHADGGPLLERRGDRVLLGGPAAGEAGKTPSDVTSEVARARADIVAKHRGLGDDIRPRCTQQVEVLPDGDVSLSLTTTVDPESAANGKPLAGGVWDISTRVVLLGWSLERRIPAAGSDAADGGRAAVVGTAPRLAVAYATVPHGNLSLDLTGRGRVVNEALHRPAAVPRSERAERMAVLTIPLPLAADREYPVVLWLRNRAADTKADFAARVIPRGDVAVIEARLTLDDARTLVGGVWETALGLPGGPAGGVPLGVEVVVSGPRHVTIARSGRSRPPYRTRRRFARGGTSWLRRQAGRLRRRLRSRVR